MFLVKSISRQIVQEEGVRALFKGLAPHLVGVTPSRLVYIYLFIYICLLFIDTDFKYLWKECFLNWPKKETQN